MTPAQAELLLFLNLDTRTPAAEKAGLRRTLQEFVREYGWWYEPNERPPQIALGTPNQCHTNAADLMLADNSLIYCEGYVLYRLGCIPVIHGWVTDGTGRAIDNTLEPPGLAYAGVPFTGLFVATTSVTNGAVISLLDDWTNLYPLRGELGDRPEKWLEPKGMGVVRVNQQRS